MCVWFKHAKLRKQVNVIKNSQSHPSSTIIHDLHATIKFRLYWKLAPDSHYD